MQYPSGCGRSLGRVKEGGFIGYKFRWWHFHVSVGAAIVIALTLILGGGATYTYVHGVKLDKQGRAALAAVAANHELGDGAIVTEAPPSAAIKKLNAQAARQARIKYPTLAAPEPIAKDCWVRNYSSRHGAHPLLFVVHDTESPNVPGRGTAGLQDIYAICSWFNNPNSQASSNYTTDADGNTLHLVADSEKAWTQAGFNSYAISDELIGYATQTTWPFAQRLATARIAAHVMAEYHIPIQTGLVNGSTCQVIRPGIVMHLNLGVCGGGHHDAGPHFPMASFVKLVKSLTHPVVAKPSRAVLRARARTAVLALRRKGESWSQIKATPQFRLYVSLGGH